jgi:RNA polymerase sigma-70 factor (ECF subfamily)
MNLDEDQKLIRKILNGNNQAFEELMKKYETRIYNYIYRMVRNPEVATELSQDFFLKIFRMLSTYNFLYKFSTWSYRICYNLVIDHLRKERMKTSSMENELIRHRVVKEQTRGAKSDAVKVLEKEELRAGVWEAVERIPPKYRELILLRYVGDKKYHEIAEISDLPLGTIKNRIFKAKKLLRQEIKKNGLLT